jgi:hypothetical protein
LILAFSDLLAFWQSRLMTGFAKIAEMVRLDSLGFSALIESLRTNSDALCERLLISSLTPRVGIGGRLHFALVSDQGRYFCSGRGDGGLRNYQ